jgi:hypothetical protein
MLQNYPISESVPPNSSRVYFPSGRFHTPIKIVRIYPNFAINTQRLLKVFPYVTANYGYDSTSSGADQTLPGALQLLRGDGYIVGDGQEGERTIHVNRTFPAGMWLAIRGVNADVSNNHTLDFSFEIEELTNG